jgi:hypothetical protein
MYFNIIYIYISSIIYNKKKIIKMIAPGSLNKVIMRIVQKFTGIFILINDPSKFIANSKTNAINKDLNNHFKNFFIISPI